MFSTRIQCRKLLDVLSFASITSRNVVYVISPIIHNMYDRKEALQISEWVTERFLSVIKSSILFSTIFTWSGNMRGPCYFRYPTGQSYRTYFIPLIILWSGNYKKYFTDIDFLFSSVLIITLSKLIKIVSSKYSVKQSTSLKV